MQELYDLSINLCAGSQFSGIEHKKGFEQPNGIYTFHSLRPLTHMTISSHYRPN